MIILQKIKTFIFIFFVTILINFIAGGITGLIVYTPLSLTPLPPTLLYILTGGIIGGTISYITLFLSDINGTPITYKRTIILLSIINGSLALLNIEHMNIDYALDPDKRIMIGAAYIFPIGITLGFVSSLFLATMAIITPSKSKETKQTELAWTEFIANYNKSFDLPTKETTMPLTQKIRIFVITTLLGTALNHIVAIMTGLIIYDTLGLLFTNQAIIRVLTGVIIGSAMTSTMIWFTELHGRGRNLHYPASIFAGMIFGVILITAQDIHALELTNQPFIGRYLGAAASPYFGLPLSALLAIAKIRYPQPSSPAIISSRPSSNS
ncbi:MAG TPA: hypothetical protein VLL52_18555 [Anaerolineae bacterium]|nr:hypothetical protein [Anaerolineae bacterium]